jgi:hypothetical protein
MAKEHVRGNVDKDTLLEAQQYALECSIEEKLDGKELQRYHELQQELSDLKTFIANLRESITIF